MHRHNGHGLGNINLEIDDDNENYINIDYVDRNNNGNDERINTNLKKINTNTADISSNLSQISTNTGSISTNSRQINTNKGNISSNLEKINNITKTIMLKDIYFTNFDSTDESFSKELLSLNNIAGTIRSGIIHTINMKYYFKKDDVIEFDCKLMFHHSTYDYSNSTFIYYNLYQEVDEKNKILFREIRRYNQFSLKSKHNRVIAYSKLCYKVKYDIDNIIFTVNLATTHSRMNVVYSHYIVQNGLNYISVKHYGKS